MHAPYCGRILDKKEMIEDFIECKGCLTRIDIPSLDEEPKEAQPPRVFMTVVGILQLLYWAGDFFLSQGWATPLYSTSTRCVIGVSLLWLARKVSTKGAEQDDKLLALAIYILSGKIILMLCFDQFFYSRHLLLEYLGMPLQYYKPCGIGVVIVSTLPKTLRV